MTNLTNIILSPTSSNVSSIISKKPKLISKSELVYLGSNIKLVSYDPLPDLISNSNKSFSPRLLIYNPQIYLKFSPNFMWFHLQKLNNTIKYYNIIDRIL